MNPHDPQNAPDESTSPQTQMSQTTQLPETNPVVQKVPFYRSYWTFGAIYLVLPPIIGLAILLTGDVYRKQKNGQLQSVRKREKITLTILAFIFWGYLILK